MSNSSIPVHGPQFKVTLFKTVQRQTIDGKEKVSVRYGTIDLTPFFTDLSTITTSKSVREPAGGFSLTVSDRPYAIQSGSDSLYGVVEPMDMIEIRFRHVGDGNPTIPVIMRGIVADISRSETVDPVGAPIRTVTVTGQDYGKFWQMLQIFYGPDYVIGQAILSAFAMFERFGAGFKIAQPGTQFLQECFDKILNPYVKNIVSGNSTNPATIEFKGLQKHGITSLSGTQNKQGVSLFDLFREFMDVGTWNELFITEDNDKVYCIYRPNPALDLHEKPIDPSSVAPVAYDASKKDVTKLVKYTIEAADIVSMKLTRSDANVANYYWVRGPRYELVSDIFQRQAAATGPDKSTIDTTGYVNTKGDLYGIRKLEAETQMGGDEITNTSSGQISDEQVKRDTSMMNWIASRRKILVEQNRDNVLLERGQIVIKGHEEIRAGNYLVLKRGTFTAMYYIVQVDHNFSPFNRFTTTLQVDRGHGFVERMRRNGGADSPYYAEMST